MILTPFTPSRASLEPYRATARSRSAAGDRRSGVGRLGGFPHRTGPREPGAQVEELADPQVRSCQQDGVSQVGQVVRDKAADAGVRSARASGEMAVGLVVVVAACQVVIDAGTVAGPNGGTSSVTAPSFTVTRPCRPGHSQRPSACCWPSSAGLHGLLAHGARGDSAARSGKSGKITASMSSSFRSV